jgi:hypothetical protein
MELKENVNLTEPDGSAINETGSAMESTEKRVDTKTH